jgi:hypothetical protein
MVRVDRLAAVLDAEQQLDVRRGGRGTLTQGQRGRGKRDDRLLERTHVALRIGVGVGGRHDGHQERDGAE